MAKPIECILELSVAETKVFLEDRLKPNPARDKFIAEAKNTKFVIR